MEKRETEKEKERKNMNKLVNGNKSSVNVGKHCPDAQGTTLKIH